MKRIILLFVCLFAYLAITPVHAETDYVARKWIKMLINGSEGSYKGFEAGIMKSPRVSGPTITSSGVGTVASTTSAVEYGNATSHQTVLTLSDVPVVVVGATGVGFGGTKIYDLPEGRILVQGVTVDSLIVTVGTGLDAADGGDWSFGTAITTNATLDGVNVDIAPKTSADAINSTNSTALAASAQFDGTTTAKDININMIIDDADIAATVTNTVDATVTVTWINLGDY